MKTEEQVKDIIRHLNGNIIQRNIIAIDNLYQGNTREALSNMATLEQLRYTVKMLEYILDNDCVMGEDY